METLRESSVRLLNSRCVAAGVGSPREMPPALPDGAAY